MYWIKGANNIYGATDKQILDSINYSFIEKKVSEYHFFKAFRAYYFV